MKKLISLLKACMSSNMQLFKIKSKSEKKSSKIVLPIVLFIICSFSVWSYANMIMGPLSKANLEYVALTLFVLVSFILTLVEGIYKAGSVFIKEVNAGETLEKEITDIKIVGSVSITSSVNGYVILCNDCALFIPENPAFATTELLKILVASINQLCLLIDTNLPLIATGISSAGSSYTPVLTNPIMQPVVQAMTQLQQTTSTEPNTKLPDIPIPSNINDLSSVEIETLIEEQEDKLNLLNKALGVATSKINDMLAPIMGIIDLINFFANAGVDTAKAAVQQVKDYKTKLEDKKKEKEQEEKGEVD